MPQPQLIYSFTTREFEHQEKGIGWYVTVGVIVLLVIAYLYYISKDWFGMLTILIIGALVMFFGAQKPREILVQISDKGIMVGSAYFSYSTLKRFWIADHIQTPELHIESTAYLNRFVTLMLADQDPEQISGILVQFIPESDPEPETLAQRLARKMKF